jgi:CDP-diacylglycerol--serine O-phosphatidyltransferase
MSSETRPGEAKPRRGLRRGIYIIPSAFTIGNILCGFYAIMNSLQGYQELSDIARSVVLFNNAAMAIGFAWLLDGLDGRIARMTHATSEFGVELDSIADVITFGIGPAVLAYTWGYGSTPGLQRLAWGVSFFFLVCGALRLARFNVTARAPRFATGVSPKLDKRYFLGLPIPAAAGLVASIVHFMPDPLASYDIESRRMLSWGILIIVSGLAVLMVSSIRYASFKDVGLISNKPLVILPILSILVAGIWFYSRWVLLALACVYVLHGPIMKAWSLAGRLRHSGRSSDETSPSPAIER